MGLACWDTSGALFTFEDQHRREDVHSSKQNAKNSKQNTPNDEN